MQRLPLSVWDITTKLEDLFFLSLKPLHAPWDVIEAAQASFIDFGSDTVLMFAL